MKQRQLTISSLYYDNKRVPMIRISGNWLAQSGFEIGDKIQIEVKPGSLLINLIMPENEKAGSLD
jgi:hypothetical protein